MWHWATVCVINPFIDVQQLYSHKFVCSESFHFHVPPEPSERERPQMNRERNDCRAVTWFGFVNCLLTPVISGSLACSETQSTLWLYCNLSTKNTGLLWHHRPFWLFGLTKTGNFTNKYISKLLGVMLLSCELYLVFMMFVFSWKCIFDLQYSQKTNCQRGYNSDILFRINCAGLHISYEKNCVTLRGVEFTMASESSKKSQGKIDTPHYLPECRPHGTFAGQQIKWH